MITKRRRAGQKLIVGKPEYKTIIETSLGIPCLHDEAVMELMWGLKRLMRSFVPREMSKLPKEDLLPMSRGLQMLLSRYGFDVKPEMVNDKIVVAAATLFDYDVLEDKMYPSLNEVGVHLKNMSAIDYENWGTMKLATAFKIICSYKIAHFDEMFSDDERSKLLNDSDKYQKKLSYIGCLGIYEQLLCIDEIRTCTKRKLAALVDKAKEAHASSSAEPVEIPEKTDKKAYAQQMAEPLGAT